MCAFDAAPASDAAAGAQSPAYDVHRWNTLLSVDPDIAAAAAEMRALSPRHFDLLAEKYLVLNDKVYLDAIVAKVREEVAAEQAAVEAWGQAGGPSDVCPDAAAFATVQQKDYGGQVYELGARGYCRVFSETTKRWVYFVSEAALKQAVLTGRL